MRAPVRREDSPTLRDVSVRSNPRMSFHNILAPLYPSVDFPTPLIPSIEVLFPRYPSVDVPSPRFKCFEAFAPRLKCFDAPALRSQCFDATTLLRHRVEAYTNTVQTAHQVMMHLRAPFSESAPMNDRDASEVVAFAP